MFGSARGRPNVKPKPPSWYLGKEAYEIVQSKAVCLLELRHLTAQERMHKFYAENDSPVTKDYSEAAGMCARCPVQGICLISAVLKDKTEAFGYRGGATPKQRERLWARYISTGELSTIRLRRKK